MTAGLLRLRAYGPSPFLTIFTYHRVSASRSQRFDDGVVDATPDGFDRQLATMKRYFSIVGVDEILGYVQGAELPPNPLAVTFDDGYLDNFTTALPLLQKHGVRACFFIATSYLEERRLFWWDRIAYLIKNATRPTIEIEYPARLRFDLADRGHAMGAALRIVKDVFDLDLMRYLDELTRGSGVPFDRAIERRFADEMLMTWDQVRALRAAGMDVQSHTRTHRVLQTLRPETLDDELRGSKAELERVLGEPVRAVSYPVGKTISLRPFVRQAVRDAGYEIGFSNSTGINFLWGRFDRFDVHRMAIDRDLPHDFFRSMLAVPYLTP